MTRLKKFIYKKAGKAVVKKAGMFVAKTEAKILATAAVAYLGHRLLNRAARRYPRLSRFAQT